MKQLISYLLLLSLIACGQSNDTQEDIVLNEKYANVFKSLDGRWEGIFYVYEDTLGQREEPSLVQTREIDPEFLENLPLKVSNTVDVVHIYESDSPYYQRGTIIDTYTNWEGEVVTVESDAINKVENGVMYCIVDKPDDYVVHLGSLDDENYIIWERNITSPLKIEYFKEKAEGDTYSIIGYGYYGDDDPTKSPKTWFYGVYERK